MANTVETQTLIDGSRNFVVKVHLESDGATGDLVGTNIVDASTLTPPSTNIKLMKVQSNLVGFTAEIVWDATANVHAWTIPDYEQVQDFKD